MSTRRHVSLGAPDDCAGEVPRAGAVLFRTFDYLCRLPAPASARRVSELHLTRYFTTAETEDGCTGAAMSYYETSDESMHAAEQILVEIFRRPGITIDDVRRGHHQLIAEVGLDRSRASLILAAAVAAVVSAWSVPLLEVGEHSGYRVLSRKPADWSEGIDAVLVVGYGGMLSDCVMRTNIPRVHVSDLGYYDRQAEIEGQLQQWRRAFPHRHITAGPQLRVRKDFEPFDCIWMSGSTLCNGTLEPLISATRSDARRLMQGQSCSIYPRYAFDAGISLILTSVKPRAVSRAAIGDRNGQALRPLLEGDALPWIFVAPA